MEKVFLSIAALLGALSIAIGAFAAHGLRHTLDAHALGLIETATRYQMYHALALLGVGILAKIQQPVPWPLTLAGLAFIFGMLGFSGSLYALSASGPPVLGLVTPIGGVFLLVGWIALALSALQN
ncbi:MAG TPA: DUF423 domain-containing protein [Stenomitos sp.]